MRKIAHISDLHFGRINPGIVEGLLLDFKERAPDLVVISGDLTQRARRGQFILARSFIGRIGRPVLIVPGNHDVPLYDLGRRIMSPFGRFRRYIARELNPVYKDKEIAVFGINTARRFPVVGGRISEFQVKRICRRNDLIPPGVFKAVVTHHPLLPMPRGISQSLVGRAKESLKAFGSCGVELILSGHFHFGYSGPAHFRDPESRGKILVIQASTLSTRSRGEPSAYNLICIDPPVLKLLRPAWNGRSFETAFCEEWRKTGSEWIRK
ncbi:MAG: metallophosphoesterase family protein [Syntrophales bacterium]|nr:metallophosphoesterase family protein [Syntrophales bacterium]MDD5531709.1 metallophosphoesterase family protein [Syntrophales bacterium]HPL63586.1 metallophosphoesterase family protein [Syntrophales bacterium]